MPVTPTYPGVYVEEIPSGVRTITGVATSIAAFVDFFARGPMNKAVQIFSPADFEREFGGLHRDSLASYGIQQFFLNGGTTCWVVRVASDDPRPASVSLLAAVDGAESFPLEARNPGEWGNGLRVDVDHVPGDAARFNLAVTLTETQGERTAVVTSEVFRNLTMDQDDPHFVKTVIDDAFAGSKLVTIPEEAELGTERPAQTGTLSGALSGTDSLTSDDPRLSVTIGTEGPYVARLEPLQGASHAAVAAALEKAVRAARSGSRAFSQATVTAVGNRLRIKAGPTADVPQASLPVTFANVVTGEGDQTETDETAADLGLIDAETLDGVLSGELSNDVSVPVGSGLRIRIGSVEESITLEREAVEVLDLQGIREELESSIQSIESAPPSFTGARVAVHVDNEVNRLIILSGTAGTPVTVMPVEGDETAANLGLSPAHARRITATVSGSVTMPLATEIPQDAAVNVSIGGAGPHPTDVVRAILSDTDISDIAVTLEESIRGAQNVSVPPWYAEARVAAYTSGTDNRLIVVSGFPSNTVVFGAGPPVEEEQKPTDADTIGVLELEPEQAEANVQLYQFGAGPAITGTAQGAGEPGNDGNPPDAQALIGSAAEKTGMHALLDVDLFNILCLPRVAHPQFDSDGAASVIAAATNLCEDERAFFIVDLPCDLDEVPEIRERMNVGDIVRHRNVAVYFPCVEVPDPLNEFRPRRLPPSGTMAGLYARTDTTRGVWKAPAGIEATLRGVRALAYKMTDAENGVLNPLGINCLRNFPVIGNVSWGARTLRGADQLADEWKYIPVRRLALFIEESLFRGTQWVVFEPNDEPLWSQIRLNVGAFMNNLFRQGAFQGATPREAYLVKCDSETTTQNDINLGIVNIVVGFAPLKPAEFVILKIQQLAGQIQT